MWKHDDETADAREAAWVPPSSHIERFHLEAMEGPSKGRIWTSTDDRCSIGKSDLNSFVVDDPAVSRFHCEVRLGERGARLVDLSSKNGTLLDGVPVVEGWLRDQSLIGIGDSTLQFRLVAERNEIRASNSDRFGKLVGRSLAMRRAFHDLEVAAGTDSTVLITGETGTGKEEAARAVHDQSARREGPFVVIDCSAIPRSLLESELFGHERGAFTDAVRTRVGAFEAAHGGTVFLDEVGELPVDMQPRLLRVLEARSVRRVGSTEERSIDIRLVAATNRNLRAEINEGAFREDLFYRLAVIEVELPPLRHRPQDIPLLVERLVERSGAGADSRAVLTPEVIADMQRCAWPGNVRELRNYVETCIALASPPPLGADDDSPVLRIDPRMRYEDARQAALDRFERCYLGALLDHHGNSATDAARAAGMSRSHLYRMLTKHGLR